MKMIREELIMLDNRKLMAEEWNAGCSALSWSTQDGKHLWGRNFDFNRLAQGTKVSYIPSGTEYYTCGATSTGAAGAGLRTPPWAQDF